jgi:hypothetical protein
MPTNDSKINKSHANKHRWNTNIHQVNIHLPKHSDFIPLHQLNWFCWVDIVLCTYLVFTIVLSQEIIIQIGPTWYISVSLFYHIRIKFYKICPKLHHNWTDVVNLRSCLVCVAEEKTDGDKKSWVTKGDQIKGSLFAEAEVSSAKPCRPQPADYKQACPQPADYKQACPKPANYKLAHHPQPPNQLVWRITQYSPRNRPTQCEWDHVPLQPRPKRHIQLQRAVDVILPICRK